MKPGKLWKFRDTEGVLCVLQATPKVIKLVRKLRTEGMSTAEAVRHIFDNNLQCEALQDLPRTRLMPSLLKSGA